MLTTRAYALATSRRNRVTQYAIALRAYDAAMKAGNTSHAFQWEVEIDLLWDEMTPIESLAADLAPRHKLELLAQRRADDDLSHNGF